VHSLLLAADVALELVPTGGLSVLTTDTDSPVVSETTVQLHLLHAFNVLTERLIEEIGVLLAGLSVLDASLAIEHPLRNFELQGVADDSDDLIDLIG